LHVRVQALFCDEETRAHDGARSSESQESGEMRAARKTASREHGRGSRGRKGGQYLRKEIQNGWSGS
jgi:hypothetical protein